MSQRPRLIILDTLAGVRGDRNNKDTTYEGDYRALGELQKWAGEAGLGVLILHHTRKMESEDPIDSVSGTLGLRVALIPSPCSPEPARAQRSTFADGMSRNRKRQSYSTSRIADGR